VDSYLHLIPCTGRGTPYNAIRLNFGVVAFSCLVSVTWIGEKFVTMEFYSNYVILTNIHFHLTHSLTLCSLFVYDNKTRIRILPLEPRRFEKHLIYHVSNNKQRTVPVKKMIRVGDFYGQILTVKEKAIHFAKEMWSIELTWWSDVHSFPPSHHLCVVHLMRC
jgi:hypothetical protein